MSVVAIGSAIGVAIFAVFILIVVGFAVAVLIGAVVPDFGGRGVNGGVIIVAVIPTQQSGGFAVSIPVGTIFDVCLKRDANGFSVCDSFASQREGEGMGSGREHLLGEVGNRGSEGDIPVTTAFTGSRCVHKLGPNRDAVQR